MDLSSARALLVASKNNRVQENMITLFKEETKTFGRSSIFERDVPEVPVPPANRCRMKRGRGRCRGAVSELALTQMCAYHQTRQPGDLNVDGLRCFYASNPGLFQLIFGRNSSYRAAN